MTVSRTLLAAASALLLAVTGPPAAATPAAAPPAPAAAAAVPAQPGTYAGGGFDTCTAPTDAAMTAWLASPYRAVGVYIGGANRACAQPQLTAAWVARQVAAGWHLLPLYVGPQASCTTSNKPLRIDNTRAAAQGRAAADDAAAAARALGLGAESLIVYDMEAYRTGDAACRSGVLAFIGGWTTRLHQHGFLSGFYGSMASGVADQVAAYPTAGYARPDMIDFARWDGVATTADPAIPASYWSPHRRIKQYRGDHLETWGGVTINIDNDQLDVAPLPPARSADFTGDGWSDVLARTTSSGALVAYPGVGATLDASAARSLGTGWGGFAAVVRIGDLTRDGREDVVAWQSSTGELWLYPGTGTGFGPRVKLGTNKALREITAIGDADRDGYPDLLAVGTGDNNLYLYPGRAGPGLAPRIKVGTGGWNTMSELAGVGDLDRDGVPDLVARLTSTGALYFYAGRGTAGFAGRRTLFTGWGGMRDLVGVGDFDRDGRVDLAAVQSSSGTLYLYPGTGSGTSSTFGARRQIGTGFADRRPVL